MKMMNGKKRFARWLIFLPFVVVGMSQPSQEWRKTHSFDNRYEGLVDLNTGDVDFEILSFTATPFPTFRGPIDLWVRFYSSQTATVVVTAHEIEVDRQYWMESKDIAVPRSTSGNFGPWPTGDVLLKQHVEPSNVGVLVHPLASQTVDFLPAVVSEDRDDVPAAIDRYFLYLRSKYNLRSLSYQVQSADQAFSSRITKVDMPGSAGIPFHLQIDAQKIPDGMARLILQGTVGSEKLQPVTIRFFHRRKL
jgi:hypothetical protein